MSRSFTVVSLVWLGGCAFNPPSAGISTRDAGDAGDSLPEKDADTADGTSRDADDASVRDAEETDGAPDAAEDATTPDMGIACTANAVFCDGRSRLTCNATGDGVVPGSEMLCDFTCADGACVRATNLDPASYRECDASAPELAPIAGSTVTIDALAINCSPHCGTAGVASIPTRGTIAQTDGPSIAWFCLSRMHIPPRAIVRRVSLVLDPIALFVDGDATIEGDVILVGGDASSTQAGAGGFGAGIGGPWNGGNGSPGQGACPGGGGTRAGGSGNWAGGGGGGAGFGGIGGDGGDGRSPMDDATGDGGPGGTTCSTPELVPLRGGSGGGGGADGSCNGNCGWAGGGGGGGIQIVSRARISITSLFDVSGGDGYGSQDPGLGRGGGGGGGSGGAILLEAPVLDIRGTLRAEGGSGGASAAGLGGLGATGTMIDGMFGIDFTAASEGGGGGGGGAGRVRMNRASGGMRCNRVSPEAACTEGPLLAE